ncbi:MULTISPECIES: hypothetical protein [Paenibacillus]|nr:MULTISPECIES: hypothetical protein [Paenibacillus]
MNRESAHSIVSRLPIAMAGIVHDFSANGITLSILPGTNGPIARRRLP